MTANYTTQANPICPGCHGNGYLRFRFEAEEATQNCQTCNSQGEITQKELNSYWNGSQVHGRPTGC